MIYKTLIIVVIITLCVIKANADEKKYVVTAYCACKVCCGKDAFGYTASGKKPKEGVTVAGSRSIPFGTVLQIEGVGTRIVQDRLAKQYDNRIDVYIADHSKAKKFGKKVLTVRR